MTAVSTYSFTHSINYVANNSLKSLKDVIRECGMDPGEFVRNSETILKGIKTWLESGHLKSVMLEIFDPYTGKLTCRADLDFVFEISTSDNIFFVDTEQLKWAIKKTVSIPAFAKYDIIVRTKPNRPHVIGWSSCRLRSTDGLVRQSFGTNIRHNEHGANVSIWRKKH